MDDAERRLGLLCGVLLVTGLFAGCAQKAPAPAASQGGDASQSGAFPALAAPDRAAATAHAWQRDAVLVELAALEVPAGSPLVGATSESSEDAPPFPAGPDGRIGDGIAAQWYLRYRSAEHPETILDVAVYADGTIAQREVPDNQSVPSDAIGNWSLDSPQAAALALQDAKLNAVAPEGLFYDLRPGGRAARFLSPWPEPFWVISPATSTNGTIMFVNAWTGEVSDMEKEFAKIGFPTGEA